MVSSNIKKLYQRLYARLQRGIDVIEINDDSPAAIALAPVEKGMSQFITIDDLPDLKELPFIPERKRDFAYRYATEYMTHAKWATEYNVSTDTIERWLKHPGVRSYIALCTLEKRFYTMARRSALENRVWKRLNEFMNIKITGDNANAVARVLEFAYKILNDPSELNGREKGTFNQIIYAGGPGVPPTEGNPYAAPERDVSPNPRQLEEFQRRLDNLKALKERRAELDDKS